MYWCTPVSTCGGFLAGPKLSTEIYFFLFSDLFSKKSIWVWRLCIIVTYSSFLGVSMCSTVLCCTIIRGHSYCTYLRNSNFGCPKWNGNSPKMSFTYLSNRSFLVSTLNFKTPFLNTPFLLSIELLLVNKAQLQQSSGGAARTYLEASMYTILRLYPFNVQILQWCKVQVPSF